MHLSTIAKLIGGRLLGEDVSVRKIVIDGRKAQSGDCYIAIKGENLDGHQFIEQAIEHGAAAVIVSEEGSYSAPIVVVPDTADALGKLAQYHREQFAIPVVALTGSCGKTTVKEMLGAILQGEAWVTPGNWNNHLGVPLSLLELNASHRFGVFELGANHIGEIARTVAWVQPHVAMINNIAPAHLEGFGSIEGVATAKAEIFSTLTENDIAVVNLDDVRVVERARKVVARKITFSLTDHNANVYANDISEVAFAPGQYQFTLHANGETLPVTLGVPGKHNIANALAATACSLALNVPLIQIQQGLSGFTGVKGRLVRHQGKCGATIIDDTYNANLHSVKAAIDVLAMEKNSTILVLGELSEVGIELESHYRQIGKYAQEKGIDNVFTCGNQVQQVINAFGKGGKHFETKAALLSELRPLLDTKVAVLIKGSRSAKMETIVAELLSSHD